MGTNTEIIAEKNPLNYPGTPFEGGSLCLSHLETRLKIMHPAYFAMVMATGIIALASKTFGFHAFYLILSWINILVYPILWGLFLLRAWKFPREFIADWSDHGRAPGFFTMVAATGVLGSQAVIIHGNVLAGTLLWWLGLFLWAVCTYTVFLLLTIKEDKPTLAQGINGGWLVAVVAAQSVCVLGCVLKGSILPDRETALFVLMAFWLGGGMLYFWIISLIFFRYLFFPFSPRDLMPPYWINMGAVAISTLAGSLLAVEAASSTLIGPLRPFILGLTLMFWATATGWIPMLLILGFWRHQFHRVKITYDPMYWGLVFPFGMYSVCSYNLSRVVPTDLLVQIAKLFAVLGAGVWLLTFLGLARRILYTLLLLFRGSPEKKLLKYVEFNPQQLNVKKGVSL